MLSEEILNNLKDSLISVINNQENNFDIIRCKNGKKIKIKKSRRGLFTKYCGGNVTEECIKKGKNSLNPAIRKRAVFASNARKWSKKK